MRSVSIFNSWKCNESTPYINYIIFCDMCEQNDWESILRYYDNEYYLKNYDKKYLCFELSCLVGNIEITKKIYNCVQFNKYELNLTLFDLIQNYNIKSNTQSLFEMLDYLKLIGIKWTNCWYTCPSYTCIDMYFEYTRWSAQNWVLILHYLITVTFKDDSLPPKWAMKILFQHACETNVIHVAQWVQSLYPMYTFTLKMENGVIVHGKHNTEKEIKWEKRKQLILSTHPSSNSDFDLLPEEIVKYIATFV